MFLLFSLLIFNDFITIDLGTEYYKVAKANFKGDPVIVNNQGIGVSVPNAVAFKSSKPIQVPLTNETMDDVEIKYDRQALSILKKNSSLGFQFIPRVIARTNTTEFNTTKIISPFQAFTLSFINLIQKIDFTGAITFVIPHYWTPEQKYIVTSVCNMFRIPLGYLIEDIDAIGIHYAATRSNRFRNSKNISTSYNVLFVDIGGTTTKVYGFHFYIDSDKAIASENCYYWSEKIGGYWFRKALSQNLNISMKKAEKLLHSESDIQKVVENTENITNSLFRLIRGATNQANAFSNVNNAPNIQEVQIIGGASSYPFIFDLIKTATNCSNIKKELNPNEAIAIGGVYLALQSSDSSKFTPVYVYKRPPTNITLQCQNENEYCVRGIRCTRNIYEYKSKGCEKVLLYTDKVNTPEGLSNIISTTVLTNISNITYENGENGYGRFEMSPSSLSIDKVEWCKSPDGNVDPKSVCYPIKIHNIFGFEKELRKEAEWVVDYWQLMRKRKEKADILVSINDLLVRLDTFFSKIENGKVEVSVHVTDEQKQTYKDLSAKYYKGNMNSLSFDTLNQTYYEIRNLAKSLRMKMKDEENDEL